MVKLKLNNWPQILVFSDENQHKISAGLCWGRKKLWDSLVLGQIYSNSHSKVRSIIIYRETPDSFEVDFLMTASNYLGKGIMSSNFNYLKSLSKSSLKPVWLEVNENNLRAIKLYLSKGFKFERIRRNYYKNGENARVYSYFPTN